MSDKLLLEVARVLYGLLEYQEANARDLRIRDLRRQLKMALKESGNPIHGEDR